MQGQLLTLLESRSVGIWIRVSTEFQVQGDSPLHHEARAREYAVSKNWQVTEMYKLEAVSGKSVLWHPETKRMLEDVKSGRITALIVSKFARLVRNTRELLELSDVFREHQAEIVSLDEPINIATSSGRLFLTIMSGLAEWEREEIASRVSVSIPIRAKLGKPLGGAAPYGYQWRDKQLIVDPKEAPIRAKMYELYIEHKRLKIVGRLMNKLGYRTRNGSRWSDTTVSRLIQDPSAKGTRRANYTFTKNNRKRWDLKPQSEWVFVPIEAIVPVEVWERANMILAVSKIKNRRKSYALRLFAGLVYCNCGNKMYEWSHGPKYTCSKHRVGNPKFKIRTEDLETIFLEGVRLLLSPTNVERLFERVHTDIGEKQRSIEKLNGEMASIRAEMDKCYRAYVAGHLDESDFGRFYSPLKSRLSRMEGPLAELIEQRALFERWSLSKSTMIQNVFDILNRWWPMVPVERKQSLLENIVKRIEVHCDHARIEFCHLATLAAEGCFDFSGFALLCDLEVTIPRDPSKMIPEDENGRRLIIVA